MAQFNFTFQPGITFEYILGFEVAERILSHYIQDDITVNLHVAFTDELPDGVIGGAVPINVITDVSTVQTALTQDISSTDDALAVANLNVSIGDNGTVQYNGQYGEGVYSGDRLTLTQANAKALGIEPSSASQLDGYILLSNLEDSPYRWNTDYSRTQTANNDSLDLLSVILHELGHVLGFVSGVDSLESVTSTNRLSALSLLDLYRYSAESLAQNAQEITPGNDAYFSIDGGKTAIAPFSSGLADVLGGAVGYQASHWANNALDQLSNGRTSGDSTQQITDFVATLFNQSSAATTADDVPDLFDLLVDPNIGRSIFEGQTANVTIDTEGGLSLGIMDPALAPGERSQLSALDLQAFNVLGYDVSSDPKPIDYGAVLRESQTELTRLIGLNPNDTSALERDRWQDVLNALEDNAEIYERRRKRYNTRKGSFWQEDDVDLTSVNILSDGAGETAQILIDGSTGNSSDVITTVKANAPQVPLVLRTINLEGNEANDLIIPATDVFQIIDAGDGENVVQLGNNGGMVISGDGNDTVLSLDNNVIVTPGLGDNIVVLDSNLESVTNHQVITQTGDDYVVSTGADRVSLSTSAGDDIVDVDSAQASIYVSDGDDIVKLQVTEDATVYAGDGNDQLQIVSDKTATVQTGKGNDVVILGDRSTPYYANNKNADVITITDFSDTDRLQLYGTRRDYSIVGNGLFYQGDLIARFENGINFTLSSSQLQFVNQSTPKNQDRAVAIPKVGEKLAEIQAGYTRGPDPTYSIVGGRDRDRFVIDSRSGELRFTTPPTTRGAYDVIVQAKSEGQTDTQRLAVTLTGDALQNDAQLQDITAPQAIATSQTVATSQAIVNLDQFSKASPKTTTTQNNAVISPQPEISASTDSKAADRESIDRDFADDHPVNDPKTGVIGNRVFLDTNGDGYRQKSEGGVAGIRVTLMGAGGDNEWGTNDDLRLTRTTNNNGKFNFKNLKGGRYQLSVDAPDGFTFTTQNVGSEDGDSDVDANGMTDVVILAPGEKNNQVDVGLIRRETTIIDSSKATKTDNNEGPAAIETIAPNDPGTGIIGNKVFLDENRDGRRQSNEAGIEGVTVTLIGAGADGIFDTEDDRNWTKITNRKGQFSFKNLRSGDYRLAIAPPDEFSVTKQNVGSEEQDSDADINGITDVFTLAVGEKNNKIDVGLIAQPLTQEIAQEIAQELAQLPINKTSNLAIDIVDDEVTETVRETQNKGLAIDLTAIAKKRPSKSQNTEDIQPPAPKTSEEEALQSNTGTAINETPKIVLNAIDDRATVAANVPSRIKQTTLRPGPVKLLPVTGLSGDLTDDITHTVSSDQGDVIVSLTQREYQAVGDIRSIQRGGRGSNTHTFSQAVQGAELTINNFGRFWGLAGTEESARIWLDDRVFDLKAGLDAGTVSLSNNLGAFISDDGLLVNNNEAGDFSNSELITLTIDQSFSSIKIENLNQKGGGFNYRLNVKANDGFIKESVKVDNPDFNGINAIAINVLENDVSASSPANSSTIAPFTVASVDSPLNGTAEIVDNQVVYTPNIGFSGIETFDYTIRDNTGATDTATLQVIVGSPVNSALIANSAVSNSVSNSVSNFASATVDARSGKATATALGVITVDGITDSVAITQGEAIAIDVLTNWTTNQVTNQANPETNSLRIRNVAPPTDGRAEIINNQLVYTPNPGFLGIDTIEYTLSDGNGKRNTAQVDVNVLSPIVDLAIEKNVENLSNPGNGDIIDPTNVARVTLTVTNTAYSVATGITVEDMIMNVFDVREPGEQFENFYGKANFSKSGNLLQVHSWTSGDVYEDGEVTFQRDRFLSTLDTNPVDSTDGQVTIYDPGQTYAEDRSKNGLITWELGQSLGPGESATLEYYMRQNTVREFPEDRRAIAQVTAVDQDDANLDNNRAIYWTPIAFDLNGDGIQTLSINDGVKFDLDNTGTAINTGWLAGGDGFLAIDNDGDGVISSRSELFGGAAVGDGFAKLASFDSNGDGLVNETDTHFSDLTLWQDANENGITDQGELRSLQAMGITDLKTAYTNIFSIDAQGNVHGEHSVASLRGRSVDMVDVYFQTEEILGSIE